MDELSQPKPAALRAKSHMPDTVFYQKIVPALLMFMGIVMLALMAFALSVILGYVHL